MSTFHDLYMDRLLLSLNKYLLGIRFKKKTLRYFHQNHLDIQIISHAARSIINNKNMRMHIHFCCEKGEKEHILIDFTSYKAKNYRFGAK